jgi:DNA replication and repair protein RecF
VTGSAPSPSPESKTGSGARLWIERLRLTDFRNYESLALDLDPDPVVLTGPNGSGKTNLLEAVSLLAPGRGLRRAPFAELVRAGYTPATNGTGRQVRIDGVPARGSGVLGDHVRLVWLTPAMDGLFTGPAGERRAFLDRLIQSLDPGYRTTLSRFERAMRQRNALLERGALSPSEYEGLETQMAEAGVALAAARAEAIGRLRAETVAAREAGGTQPFPWATLALEGALEARLEHEAAIDVEDGYRAMLERGRERDRAAKRTLEGPHRSDLIVGHGPKAMPARRCSTGEQKALLIGLVLAHARLVKQASGGLAPLILLDEIVAHLDEARREALFAEILRLEAQAWMTGVDQSQFSPLGGGARFLTVEQGRIIP